MKHIIHRPTGIVCFGVIFDRFSQDRRLADVRFAPRAAVPGSNWAHCV